MFFWAWEQHKKAQAELWEELRKEGREQADKEYAPKIQELAEANRELHARISELEYRQESAAKIRELKAFNRELQARISDLESRNGARRGRPYRRALRRQRAV